MAAAKSNKKLTKKKGALATTKSGGLKASARRKTATIKPSKDHPSGRFPMPDEKHARLALQDLPKAKGLSPEEKAAIRARAEKKLGKKTSNAK
jgi:predicted Zn-dependent protease